MLQQAGTRMRLHTLQHLGLICSHRCLEMAEVRQVGAPTLIKGQGSRVQGLHAGAGEAAGGQGARLVKEDCAQGGQGIQGCPCAHHNAPAGAWVPVAH